MTQPPEPPPPFGQHHYYWPYGYPPPPPPPKKPLYQRTWFGVVVTVFGLLLVASVLDGGGPQPTPRVSATAVVADPSTAGPSPVDPATADPGTTDPSALPARSADAPPALPGIGQPAADGRFSFVVNGVDCSRTRLGGQYFNTTAQGKYCIIDLTISNIGDEPRSFSDGNTMLFNAEGQRFSADSGAAFYLDEAETYEDINPGNSLTTKVVFDVPADMTPTSVELHDSAFSGGVTISLE